MLRYYNVGCMLSELTQIKTKDGLWLEGLVFGSTGSPQVNRQSKKGQAIAFWLSGLTGMLSDNPARVNAVAGELAKKKISFAVFNHRGFGNINSLKIKSRKFEGHRYFGASFERFEDSVLDIEAIIHFCKKRGYKKIFLLGHSTGANKAAYYILKKHGRGLTGIAFLGPMSDIPGIKKDLGRKYKTTLGTAEKMVKRGRSDELLPLSMTNGMFYGAARFFSIAREGANEDTFPYYDAKRKFRWTEKVRLPVFVLIGSREQHADRPVPEIMEAFRKQIDPKYFSGKIIKGANHSFRKKEKELGKNIADWISAVS